MNVATAAYIAGLFDGEGSVEFRTYLARKNGQPYPDQRRYGRLLVRISQKDRMVLDWVQRELGFGTVQVAHRVPLCHAYMASHVAARQFIAVVRPFLIVKADSVDRALDADQRNVMPRSSTG